MGSKFNASCGGGGFQTGSTLSGGVGEAQKIFFNSC